ncbi:hypothetical protein O6H91_06G006800 [Diphasiastrum complanatum]|uniref:Uncharacterized protein n=1 Tax=Diphasiastrum complanatum TaxID=34168 RepID=A0ACC2DAE2_DIPCM|nr:hypothetical protein O6H91_06G006800 [Diphasiastrum complanatum]
MAYSKRAIVAVAVVITLLVTLSEAATRAPAPAPAPHSHPFSGSNHGTSVPVFAGIAAVFVAVLINRL